MQYPDILNFYNSTIKKHYSKASAALHDPLAVAVVLDRALVEASLTYVHAEIIKDLSGSSIKTALWLLIGNT